MNFSQFFYNSVEIQDENTIDKVEGDLKLTCEFEGNLQPRRCLANLKVTDLKTHLLYLAPVIFGPFVFTTNSECDLDDSNLVVQAV